MKEIINLVIIIMVLFSLGFTVSADDKVGPYHDEVIAAGGQDGNPISGEGIGVAVKSGVHINNAGKEMRIQHQANNRLRLEVGDSYADSLCNITQEQFENRTRLYVRMSNGINSEIKIMPDGASETALRRLKLRTCDEDCEIQLKEIGSGERVKLAYEMKVQRQSKVFGLFKARMQVQTQVDAETGEILGVKKPWWAFLASEPEE